MPPVNTPSDPPSRSPLAASSASSSLQPRITVSIPVTSFSTPVPDDAHDDNVSFLRSRVRSSPDSSSTLSRQRRRRQQIFSEFDLEPMDDVEDAGLRMSVEINRRIPIMRRQRDPTSNESNNSINNSNLSNVPNYESRVSNSRLLYGWAPASDDDDDDDDDMPPPPIQNGSLSSWLGLADRNSSRRSTHRSVPEDAADSSSHRLGNPPLSTTEALLQSVRRQPRFSRTRTLHNYLERTSQDSDEGRERPGATPPSRAYRFLPSSRGEPHRFLTHNDLRARISAHRQMHLENPPSPRLKETIRYLERLRYSNSFEESLTSAAAGGFVQLDLFTWDEEDFILDTASISPPPECSWLRPGMTFSGCQRATSGTGTIFPPGIPSPSTLDPIIVSGSEPNNRISVQTSNGRRYIANQVHSAKDENWPVKVTIHNINTQEMTLSGTMEAYNIPDKTSPSHDAHIVTFLEGEVIDFNKHTLETKNFKADTEIDSTYWRQLHPFKNLTDEEMTRNLVSRKWITEELSKGWILMRWKERCFITPTDARQGLTISGFYYISLHRETGHIEGLYYDPGSSPYQQLSLKPETKKMVRPSYSFR